MKTPVKIALAVVFVLAAAGIGTALYLYNLKPKDLLNVKPDYVITSTDLLKAFEEDEVVSSAKYINKVVEVTGEIIGIEDVEKKSWNISLQTGSDLSKVICTFPVVTDPGIFNLGREITVRGECSGFLMDVLLNNSVVVEERK